MARITAQDVALGAADVVLGAYYAAKRLPQSAHGTAVEQAYVSARDCLLPVARRYFHDRLSAEKNPEIDAIVAKATTVSLVRKKTIVDEMGKLAARVLFDWADCRSQPVSADDLAHKYEEVRSGLLPESWPSLAAAVVLYRKDLAELLGLRRAG